MAVVNTKSTIVTAADAGTGGKISPYIFKTRLQEFVATVEVAAADDDGSVLRLFRVNSGDRVSELLLWNDAITVGSDYGLGLYDIADNGGAVVNATLWGSAITMATARLVPLDATFEAADIINIEKTIWQLLGLTADPMKQYDIALTATVIGTGAGTISAKLRLATPN